MTRSTAPSPDSRVDPCPPEVKAALHDALTHVGDPAVVPFLQRFQTIYHDLDPAGRLAVFVHLAEGLEIGPLAANPALATVDGSAPEGMLAGIPGDLSDPAAVDRLLRLRAALEAPRLKLLRQFANVPNGVKFLVDLRADLLALMRQHPERPSLRLVDDDLLHLLRSWFNFGFLELVPIDWETTSAAQLEKLMAYEVVHPMSDWASLRRRLQKDRLCYAFYHPNMPREPLIFVEVALTLTIASSVDRLIQEHVADDATQMTTAIFYSINATQTGLGGVSLGNSLIKMVVGELRQRYPNLRRFATLSPMPRFRQYVERLLAGESEARGYQLQRDRVGEFFDPADAQTLCDAAGQPTLPEALQALFADGTWVHDEGLSFAMKGGMLRLAHHYLMHEQRKNRPIDPVAQFHLRNGAMLYNLNYLSDTSDKGLADSFGTTANYLYDPDAIDENQQRWKAGDLAVAPQLEKMLRLGISA